MRARLGPRGGGAVAGAAGWCVGAEAGAEEGGRGWRGVLDNERFRPAGGVCACALWRLQCLGGVMHVRTGVLSRLGLPKQSAITCASRPLELHKQS